MMDFTSEDYTSEDFKKEEDLFTQFYYDEGFGAPGVEWYTNYYYRKLDNGRYRLVELDIMSNELYCHEEYASARDFAAHLNRYIEDKELEPYLDDELLSLFPDDLKQDKEEVASNFNEITASLIHIALEEGDRDLVQAFLPDFNYLRNRNNPVPYIPGISKRELERKKEIYRKYFLSQGYVEESPDCFVKESFGWREAARIGEYDLTCTLRTKMGGKRKTTLFEYLSDKPNVKYF